jgi:hypothetical protein
MAACSVAISEMTVGHASLVDRDWYQVRGQRHWCTLNGNPNDICTLQRIQSYDHD